MKNLKEKINTKKSKLDVGKTQEFFDEIINSDALLNSEEKMLLFSLIYGLKPNKVLEIGSYKGGSAEIICKALDSNNLGELTLIDINPQISDKTWKRIKHRTKILTGNSDYVIKKFEISDNEKFDFIFIDGDHNYEAILKDTYNSINILNNNGYILYHDCHNKEVERAIDNVINFTNLKDCGILSREINKDYPGQLWAGFRLLRKTDYNLSLFKIIKYKIEGKRNSKNILWKPLVITKDIIWKLTNLMPKNEISKESNKLKKTQSEEQKKEESIKDLFNNKLYNKRFIKNYKKNKKFIGLKPEVFFKPQIWKNRPKGRGIKPNLSNKEKISLLFLTHNMPEKTKTSLESFKNALHRKDIKEMLILDNNSESETCNYLSSLEKNKKIKIIYYKKNLGVCKARDILFKKAKGEIIFSIDSDAILLNEKFLDLGKMILNDNKIGICGPIGSIFNSWKVGDHTDINLNYFGEVDHISGCCQIFRKKILKKVFLDLKFSPFWYEDVDFCFQIKNLKLKVYKFDPQGTFFHEWGHSGAMFPGLFEEKHKIFRKKWENKIKLRLININQKSNIL